MRREEIITRSKRRHIFASIAPLCLPEHFKQCITISKLVKCDSLSTHEKQDEIVFVGLYLIIFLLARLQAESERAAINQLIFAVNLCRRCHNSHEAGRVDGASCMGSCLMRWRLFLRNQRFCWGKDNKPLSFLMVSFNVCRQSNIPPNAFCFQPSS